MKKPQYMTVVFKIYDQELFKHELDRLYRLMKNEDSKIKVGYTMTAIAQGDEITRSALVCECLDSRQERREDLYNMENTLTEIYKLRTTEDFEKFRFYDEDGEPTIVPECMPQKPKFKTKNNKPLLEKPLEMFIRMQAFRRGVEYCNSQERFVLKHQLTWKN